MSGNITVKNIVLSLVLAVILVGGTISTVIPAYGTHVATGSIRIANPSGIGNFDSWKVSGTTNKVTAVSDSSDTTFVYRDANAKRQTFKVTVAGTALPAGADITDVTFVVMARSPLVNNNAFQFSVEKGTTAKNIKDNPSLSVITTAGNTFVRIAKVYPTNPFTGAKWDASDFSASSVYRYGFNNQQQQASRIDIAKFFLEIRTPDSVAPTGSVSINSGDASTTSNTVNLTITCSDGGGSGCYKYYVNGGAGVLLSDGTITVPATLSPGRGVKTVSVVLEDNAHNTATVTDTIELIPTISLTTGPTPTTASWGLSPGGEGGDEVVIGGGATNTLSGDRILVNWGSPSEKVLISGGSWQAKHIYGPPSVDGTSHSISVSLVVDSDNSPVVSVPTSIPAGPVTITRHDTEATLDPITGVDANGPFFIHVSLKDKKISDPSKNGVSGKIVRLTGSGVTPDLENPVTGGLVINDQNGMAIVNGLLQLHAGSTLSLPVPISVSAPLGDGEDPVTYTFTNGAGKTIGPITTVAPPDQLQSLDIIDPTGVASIQITGVGGGTAGFSGITLFNGGLLKILGVDFGSIPDPNGAKTLTFDGGGATSEGTAPSQDGVAFNVNAQFDGKVDSLAFFDVCPLDKEDINGFEDNDGCPDSGNADADGDAKANVDDACPIDAETINGFEDTDGCPDEVDEGIGNVDTDGDAIENVDDACPIDAETINGFEDTDGCPDARGYADIDDDGIYVDDLDYTASNTDNTSYTPGPSTGGTGAGTTVLCDAGTGITGTACANDTDLDAICNGWENNHSIGYVVGGTTYQYPLDSTLNVGSDDLVYELDYMAGHAPSETAAISDLVTYFAGLSTPVNLIINTDEEISHVSTINVWRDTDNDRTNDFDSIKADHFGPASIRPTITTVQTNSKSPSEATAATSHTVSISGITLTTPADPRTSPVDKTDGTIKFKVKLTVTSSGSAPAFSLGTPAVTGALPANLNAIDPASIVATLTATANSKVKILSVSVPFSTSGIVSSGSFPQIDIPVTLSASKKISLTTEPISPTVGTTLLDRYAQVVRYILVAHSMGGSSGQSELKGNDIVIALGDAGWGDIDADGDNEGTLNEQKGTLLHEIGHNLNLKHGAPASEAGIVPLDSDINCKPNYRSVMTYSRQTDNLLGAGWALGFSSGVLGPITETTLAEGDDITAGLGASAPDIVWGTPGAATSYSTGPAAGSHNWNGDADSTDTGGFDVNNFGFFGCNTAGLDSTPFNDHNDVANFDFNFRATPSGSFDGAQSDPDISGTVHLTGNQEVTGDINLAVKVENALYKGLKPPFNDIGTGDYKAGSNAAVKFEVRDFVNLQSIPDLHITWTLQQVGGVVETGSCTNTGTGEFLWMPANDQYQCNWNIDPTAVGDHYLDFYVDNPLSTSNPTKHLLDETEGHFFIIPGDETEFKHTAKVIVLPQGH